jgi:hypothetical protein
MSNFAQTSRWQQAQAPQQGGVVTDGMGKCRRLEFRQYAEEAVRWARKSRTEQEKQALMDLARTWTEAATHSERILFVNSSPPQGRAL